MPFDPLKYGATPVKADTTSFNPASFGATSVQPKQSVADQLWHSLSGVAEGSAKGAIKGIQEGVGGTIGLGGAIESGLDQTLGRVGNVIAGKGNVPTNTAQGAFGASQLFDAASKDPRLDTSGSTSQKVGNIIGQGAELVAGAPADVGVLADKALAKGSQVLTQVAAKKAEEAVAKETGKIIEMVSPKQTAKETADALASRGGKKPGLFSAGSVNIDPSIERIANTVKEHVPGFNPKGSLIDNVNATKEAVGSIATDLKNRVVESGEDRIYPLKELASKLNAIEKSPELVGDAEKTYSKVIQKALDIARDNGGKVSDLFQARKEFDQYVERFFPNLYGSEKDSIMRIAIKDIRNAMTDFTADHLPEDIGLRDSLTTQSRLIQAIENMSEKASSGLTKEVGKNVLQRAGTVIKNHPAVSAFGSVAAYEAAKKIPVVGGILP